MVVPIMATRVHALFISLRKSSEDWVPAFPAASRQPLTLAADRETQAEVTFEGSVQDWRISIVNALEIL